MPTWFSPSRRDPTIASVPASVPDGVLFLQSAARLWSVAALGLYYFRIKARPLSARVFPVSGLAFYACWVWLRRSLTSCSWLDLISKSCSSGTPNSTGLSLSLSLWSFSFVASVLCRFGCLLCVAVLSVVLGSD